MKNKKCGKFPLKDGESSFMNDYNDLNMETFGEGGENPPYTPPTPNYVTYIPYGFTPKTFEERNQIKKIANIIGGSLLVLNALSILISLTITFILSFIGLSSESIHNIITDAGFNKFFQITLSTILFIVPFSIFFKCAGYRISDLAIFEKPKNKSFLPLFLMGIAFCAFSNIAVSVAGNFFEQFGINYEVDMGDYPKGFFGFLLSVIATAVIPPLVEEFACRGLILGSLRKFGDGFAIVVSSVIFGIMHGNFQQMPFAFLVGLVLAYITIKSGSLWVAIAVHAFNNFISVVFNYLPENMPDIIQNLIYIILLVIIMILGLVSLFILQKNGEDYKIEESKTESTNFQKSKWFFFSATIIIFIIISFIESLAFFV